MARAPRTLSRWERWVIDLDRLIAQAGAPASLQDVTMEALLAAPWPPALMSRYLVQADGDVVTLRDLVPRLVGRNVGLATNIDSVREMPRMRRLVTQYLLGGLPVYLDSGVYPRWRRGDPEPDFHGVLVEYGELLRESSAPDLLAVTAPDRIGDFAATVELQRRHAAGLRRLLEGGARVVVPIQASGAGRIFQSMRDVESRFPGAWIGVPVRKVNTTPLVDLVAALLSWARRSDGPVRLPKLHLFGIGGSARIEQYASRISVIYRILSGPHIYEVLRRREPQQDMLSRLISEATHDNQAVAKILVSSSESELRALVGCVQARATFPCPPDSPYTYGGSHPILDERLAELWRAHPDADLVRPGFDVRTERALGMSDRTVDLYSLVERHYDWTELCIEVIEEAEEKDPAMVPEAWDVDDLDRLMEEGAGLGRIETDATTVPFSASHGAWIVDGQQSSSTTPGWWRERPKRFRFTWNLWMTMWDRWEREQHFLYHFPDGYDERGFTVRPAMKRRSLHDMLMK